ncbi:predicted protein [Plenodomus lingam JN3]|uniref:Predicted protein n=1 Tax=Leptosphaeria maculans (strain JN3 / isolate v23.1.3 / race Av1-4-5-6-7-8) TaxID=985895 RepID=E5R4U7_LEPMJ|nr:predicted protein [Plenodomus lingam JN3]CBX92220.1 predicted protein [Plenodomus lingam JN3]
MSPESWNSCFHRRAGIRHPPWPNSLYRRLAMSRLEQTGDESLACSCSDARPTLTPAPGNGECQ